MNKLKIIFTTAIAGYLLLRENINNLNLQLSISLLMILFALLLGFSLIRELNTIKGSILNALLYLAAIYIFKLVYSDSTFNLDKYLALILIGIAVFMFAVELYRYYKTMRVKL